MRSWTLAFVLVFAGLLCCAGCSGDGGGHDAGVDAEQDAGRDGGQDAGLDAGQDAGEDGADGAGDESDAGADAGGDAGGDEARQPCELDYDCPAGQVCRLGFCEPFEPECEEDEDCEGEQVCREGICLDADLSPRWGSVIINEVLSDGSTDGDPNQDGSLDAMEDEFVELVNVSNQAVDLEGYTLVERDWDVFLPRHTFETGTQLQPLGAVVVFGGGDPPESTASVLYLGSNAEDPGFAYGLDLDDAGDRIRLLDADGLTVAVFAYGDEGGTPAVSDQSVTRAPDLTGDFVPHAEAEGAGGEIFSPGTRVDGSAF
ncbi:MAG: lamin tail domain-containing protein [Deltaproteobacteria bacterium]|nr:lamin tail domain-containing protein [Deltaproteobacteria bacterium]